MAEFEAYVIFYTAVDAPISSPPSSSAEALKILKRLGIENGIIHTVAIERLKDIIDKRKQEERPISKDERSNYKAIIR